MLVRGRDTNNCLKRAFRGNRRRAVWSVQLFMIFRLPILQSMWLTGNDKFPQGERRRQRVERWGLGRGHMIRRIVLGVRRVIHLQLLGLNYEREGKRRGEPYALTFKNLKKVTMMNMSWYPAANGSWKAPLVQANTPLKLAQLTKQTSDQWPVPTRSKNLPSSSLPKSVETQCSVLKKAPDLATIRSNPKKYKSKNLENSPNFCKSEIRM